MRRIGNEQGFNGIRCIIAIAIAGGAGSTALAYQQTVYNNPNPKVEHPNVNSTVKQVMVNNAYNPATLMNQNRVDGRYVSNSVGFVRRTLLPTYPTAFKSGTKDLETEKALNPMGFTADDKNNNPDYMQVDDCGQSCLYQKAGQTITLSQTYDEALVSQALSDLKQGNYGMVIRAFGASCDKQRDALNNAGGDKDKEEKAAKKCLEVAGAERMRNIIAGGQGKLVMDEQVARLNGGVQFEQYSPKGKPPVIKEIDPGRDPIKPVLASGAGLIMQKRRVATTQVIYIPTIGKEAPGTRTVLPGDRGDIDYEQQRLVRAQGNSAKPQVYMNIQQYQNYVKDEAKGAAGITTANLELSREVYKDKSQKTGSLQIGVTGTTNNVAAGSYAAATAEVQIGLEKSLPDAKLGPQYLAKKLEKYTEINSEQREAYGKARAAAVNAVMAENKRAAAAGSRSRAPAQVLVQAQAVNDPAGVGKNATRAITTGDATTSTYNWNSNAMTGRVAQDLKDLAAATK